MIFDMPLDKDTFCLPAHARWDLIPGSPATFLVAENETLWMQRPSRQHLRLAPSPRHCARGRYEEGAAAFTHPIWLSAAWHAVCREVGQGRKGATSLG